jgi:hypothetical protein
MNSEEPDFTALDAYIRTRLARAAESYELSTDLDAKLKAVLAAGNGTEQGDTATTHG